MIVGMDRQWIAFRRQAAGAAVGKQLWLMRADGSEARALIADATGYGAPVVVCAGGNRLKPVCTRIHRLQSVKL